MRDVNLQAMQQGKHLEVRQVTWIARNQKSTFFISAANYDRLPSNSCFKFSVQKHKPYSTKSNSSPCFLPCTPLLAMWQIIPSRTQRALVLGRYKLSLSFFPWCLVYYLGHMPICAESTKQSPVKMDENSFLIDFKNSRKYAVHQNHLAKNISFGDSCEVVPGPSVDLRSVSPSADKNWIRSTLVSNANTINEKLWVCQVSHVWLVWKNPPPKKKHFFFVFLLLPCLSCLSLLQGYDYGLCSGEHSVKCEVCDSILSSQPPRRRTGVVELVVDSSSKSTPTSAMWPHKSWALEKRPSALGVCISEKCAMTRHVSNLDKIPSSKLWRELAL